jgi:hypothetical protein
LLLLAAVLLVAAVLLNLRPRVSEKPINLVPIVVAREDIEPYSVLSSSQVTLSSTTIPETLAMDYYQASADVAGLMTTRFIAAGQQVSREDAKPIEEVRYVADMELEIVSFPAVFSEMVAGQLRPGHKINVYGYRREAGKENPGEAILVASNVWVVDVRTAAGDEVGEEMQEPEPAESGALFAAPGIGAVSQPASVVAVAAAPDVVQDVIFAFGAKGYDAWVTLAPSPESIAPIAPQPTPTPQPQEPTPAPQETVEPTSLVGAIYMSNRDGGPKLDVFPNNTSVVWAVVNLQYSPDGPVSIRLEIRDEGGNLAFTGDFAHPRSGQHSYLIAPAGGFTPDTEYTTTLHVEGERFSAKWRLQGDSVLPDTGGADLAVEDEGSHGY